MADLPPDGPTRLKGTRRRALSVAVGVGVVALMAGIDSALGRNQIVIAAVVLGPLICSLLGRSRDVAGVGAFAVLLALISPIWDAQLWQPAYFLRLSVVVIGSIVATLVASGRERLSAERARFALLSDVAEVGTRTLSLEETATELTRLIVPEAADLCAIDVAAAEDGHRRLAVAAQGNDRATLEAALMGWRPAPDTLLSPVTAMERSTAQLVTDVDDTIIGGASRPQDDPFSASRLRLRSIVIVPLVARGRALGALTLGVTGLSGRSYDRDDQRFFEVLAGRVALALDNAGLSAELETIEAQLFAAVGGLAEAITMQRAAGELVYANHAAAELMGFASVDELMRARVADLIMRSEPRHEDGRPVAAEEFPGRRLLAGEAAEPMLMRLSPSLSGRERWVMVKSTPVYDRTGNISLVVNVLEDVTAVKLSERAQRILAQAGELLASSLDYERTLQQVAELAVPELADWCSVSMPDGRGVIRTVAVAHVDPGKVTLARDITASYPTSVQGQGGVAWVLRNGSPRVTNQITREMLATGTQDDEHLKRLTELGVTAAMIVPITAGAAPAGTLNLVSAESGRSFSDADLELALELGRRAGTAIENARLYTERSRIARTLQASLLPEAFPVMPGWRARSLYRPADAEVNWVGGDFFDVIAVAGGWLVVMGDVAGHGADAAALTATARHTIRTAAKLLPDPLDAIAHLNDELVKRDRVSLCTVAAVLLRDRADGAAAEIVCAGHPLPLLVERGEVRSVGAHGPMLGAYRSEGWERVDVEIEPSSILILYTDGVLDTIGPGNERFGDGRLRDALQRVGSADEAVAGLHAAIENFRADRQADDTALVALERVGIPISSRPAGVTDLAPTVGRTLETELPRDRRASRVARRLLEQDLDLTEPELEAAKVLVTELVNNAVVHGRGRIVLHIRLAADRLRAEVIDEGSGFEATVEEVGFEEIGGRGLLLVDRIASRWGLHEGTTHVWFELDRAAHS